MKLAIPFLDTDAIPWTPSSPKISTKLINGRPDLGACTQLIRSAERPVAEYKSQCHAADEEFFCLDGRLTFDGDGWWSRYSYVFIPAGTVHGANVIVPGGYLLYLRLGGAVVANKALQPAAPHNSAAAMDSVGQKMISLRDARPDSAKSGGRPLRRAPSGMGGATLLQLGAGWMGTAAAPSGDLEMFVVEGAVDRSDGHRFSAGCYSYIPDASAPFGLRSETGALVLIHHGANLECSEAPS